MERRRLERPAEMAQQSQREEVGVGGVRGVFPGRESIPDQLPSNKWTQIFPPSPQVLSVHASSLKPRST